jgi:hypothetical protein
MDPLLLLCSPALAIQIFFATPQRAKELASWEDLVFRIFTATTTDSQTSPELLGRIKLMSKTLSKVAFQFSDCTTALGHISIHQDPGMDEIVRHLLRMATIN